VRSALRVDPSSARVFIDGAASDPIPRFVEGIPVLLRDLEIYADRPELTLNPTSCDEKAATATLVAGGLSAPLSQRYQAAGCERLGFRPRLSLHLRGGTDRGDNPALISTFKPRPGNANLRGLTIRLPHSAFLDQGHIRTICTRVRFAAEACPKGAIYGHAKAWTPLLEEPLAGPVYLRSSSNALPDLVLDLKGTVDIEAVARIDSIKGGIRATFTDLPDAPLSKAVVRMKGGAEGLVENSVNLCRGARKARVRLLAHNAKRRNFKRPVTVACNSGPSRRPAS
jgi:hypothetical protein